MSIFILVSIFIIWQDLDLFIQHFRLEIDLREKRRFLYFRSYIPEYLFFIKFKTSIFWKRKGALQLF